ncbi:spore coat protein [Candidatus Nomurabacteria bacterium RIFCSPHIGHO2_02_FULL_36_29]|nr:MAG: spore coat protein [Candidatus Nomurabacteria bacterium RIFCSPHIGHO2_02_FULL_36_29]
MKGVILAGGLGTRLGTLTKITNKHLLPVYDKPMIFYPLQILLDANINEILVVSGPEYSGHFLRLLGSGKNFNARFTYEIQDEPKGIAHALGLAEDFADNENVAVILGDNIFEDDFSNEIKSFKSGSMVFLKEVPDANRFGVVEIKEGKVVDIVEKPEKPKSNYALTGLYLFDNKVFGIIKKLKLSKRNQYEITDVIDNYLKELSLKHAFVKGFWSDAGTFDSLHRAASFIKEKREKT